MTARARSMRDAPSAVSIESAKGWSPRPRLTTLSMPARRHVAHTCARFNDALQRRRFRKRLEIRRIQVAAGRQRGCRRCLPAVLTQDRSCRRIGVEAPRREQPDMTPIAHMRGNGRAGFVELHRQATRHKMRRSCKTNRSAADDGDRQRRLNGTHAGTFAFVLRGAAFGAQAAGPHSATPPQQFSVRNPSSAFIASKRAA